MTPEEQELGSVHILTLAEAEHRQQVLATAVQIPAGPVPAPRVVAGTDVSYETGTGRLVAAVIAVDIDSGEILEEVTVAGRAVFPYVPGLLAFREMPTLLVALERLHTAVDVLLCDGQGLAHPRRCGLACHLGVETGLPAVGCAKSHFVGVHDEPGPRRGDRSPLVDGGHVVGEVLRTQDGVRPVYVSPGHRIGVAQATDLVLALCTSARLPDPVRRADHLSRQVLSEFSR